MLGDTCSRPLTLGSQNSTPGWAGAELSLRGLGGFPQEVASKLGPGKCPGGGEGADVRAAAGPARGVLGGDGSLQRGEADPALWGWGWGETEGEVSP